MSKLRIATTRLMLAMGDYQLGTVASLKRLKRQEGQTFVEYALILALISVALTASLILLRDKIKGIFTSVSNDL